MRKKRLIKCGVIFTCLVLTHFVCLGQKDTLGLSNIRSPYAAARLYEISTHVSLAPNRLKFLAHYFEKVDSFAAMDLAQGKSMENIHGLYENAERNLSHVLEAEEYAQYLDGIMGRPSIVGTAFRFGKKIFLLPKQWDSLASALARYRLSPEGVEFTDFDTRLAKKFLRKDQLKYCTWYAYEKAANIEATEKANGYRELELYKYGQSVDSARKLMKGYLLQERMETLALEISNSRFRDSVQTRLMALRPREIILFDAFTAPSDLSESFLSKAVQYRKGLGLNDIQIRAICDALESHERKYYFHHMDGFEGKLDDSRAQIQTISSILGNQGFKHLLRLKAEEMSHTMALSAWEVLSQHGYSSGWDSSQVVTEIKDYYIEKSVTSDISLGMGSSASTDSVLAVYELQRPECLLLSNALSGTLPSSPMADLLLNGDRVGLSHSQILEVNHQFHELLIRKKNWVVKFGGLRFDSDVQEGQEIRKYLPAGLYTSFISFRAMQKAHNLAQSYLDRLSAMLLIKSSDDMAKISDEIYRYSLVRITDEDNALFSGDNLVVDSVRDLYANIKPWILLKLDAYEGLLPWCEFTEAFMLRGKLWLSPVQTDSLIMLASQYGQKLRGNRLGSALSPTEDLHAFELANMPRILNTYQTEKYLYLKYYNIAQGVSRDALTKLQDENLPSPDSVLAKKMFHYQLNLLMSNERESYYHDGLSAAKKAAAESQKPDEWSQYEDILRNAEARRAAKRNLTW